MEEIKKSKRGGARPGAGRKKKAASAIVPRAASAFEAGDRHSLNRGFLLINTVDPRRELTGATRQEVMRQVRDLYNNDPRATYIIEHIAQRAVGTGIVPQAKSKNRVWNRQAERHFEDMVCQEAFAFDAAGAVNFYGAQSLILRQVAVDGDFFGQLVKSLSGMGMMRFIGAESVQGDEAPYFDGVEVGFFGRPAAYRVVPDLSKSSDAVRIPAEDILHFRHVRRAGYTRGVSWLHAAVLDVRDGKEIKTFVKGSYKLASQMGLVITSGEGFKIGSGSEETPVADGISTETVYNGTLIPKLKPGEKLETLKNEHPGQNFDPLMRYLVSAVAFSAGIPPESVMMILGAGGTEQRALLEVAQNFLERLQQQLIDQFCRRFWKYFIWHEIQAGRLAYPGDDWWRHDWIPPRKITVDNGRDGRLYSELLDKGQMSWERYCDIHGLDAEAEEDDIIAAYIRRQEKCSLLGLDPRDVFASGGRGGG
jgi:capsid protein